MKYMTTSKQLFYLHFVETRSHQGNKEIFSEMKKFYAVERWWHCVIYYYYDSEWIQNACWNLIKWQIAFDSIYRWNVKIIMKYTKFENVVGQWNDFWKYNGKRRALALFRFVLLLIIGLVADQCTSHSQPKPILKWISNLNENIQNLKQSLHHKNTETKSEWVSAAILFYFANCDAM